MAALDDPEQWTFIRDGKKSGVSGAPASRARWMDAVSGRLLLQFMDKTGVATGMANVAAWRARMGAGGGFKFGLSRRGKPLGDAGDDSQNNRESTPGR